MNGRSPLLNLNLNYIFFNVDLDDPASKLSSKVDVALWLLRIAVIIIIIVMDDILTG